MSTIFDYKELADELYGLLTGTVLPSKGRLAETTKQQLADYAEQLKTTMCYFLPDIRDRALAQNPNFKSLSFPIEEPVSTPQVKVVTPQQIASPPSNLRVVPKPTVDRQSSDDGGVETLSTIPIDPTQL